MVADEVWLAVVEAWFEEAAAPDELGAAVLTETTAAALLLIIDSPVLAFLEPQTTDWQAVMPLKSFGWLAIQLIRH